MAEYAVDLHIHSCLSPCGDEWMTPNNLCKMSMLKGLDLIAVTDHNTARQLPSVESVCREIGLNLLPGMELTTREEVHLLAYFRTVQTAVAFSDFLYPHLPTILNRSEYFGAQPILDAEDEPVAEEEKLLINALDLGLDQLTKLIREAGGLAVPAHINRGSNGLLHALGFLPPKAGFHALEVCKALPCKANLEGYRLLHSSDAHNLDTIFEREEFLPLSEPTADGFFAHILGA